MDKNLSKNLSGKYSPSSLTMHQKLLDHPKKSAIDAFKTASKKSNSKKSRSNWWFDS